MFLDTSVSINLFLMTAKLMIFHFPSLPFFSFQRLSWFIWTGDLTEVILARILQHQAIAEIVIHQGFDGLSNKLFID